MTRRFLPYVAFFLSGASSLVFQLIWSRMLHHVFGSSSVAVSSVVSVFMGGLALGAWGFGRFADRIRRPLRLYAFAELGVGLCGLAIPWLVRPEGWLAVANAWMRDSFGAQSMGLAVLRFLCLVPILIVPTTLMGSTLPLLARYYVRAAHRPDVASARVGWLYALNTFGAVSGVLMAGFVWMPSVGVMWTNAIAVGINFLLAAGITLLQQRPDASRQDVAPSRAAPEAASEAASGAAEAPASVRRVAAAAFAVSGAVALLYEVVWTRALVNTIGASVYSFTLILATFLTGIAGGSAVASVLLDARARTLYGVAAAAAVLSAIACAPAWVGGSMLAYASCWLPGVLLLGVLAYRGARRVQREGWLSEHGVGGDRVRVWGCGMLAVPIVAAGLQAIYFQDRLSGMATTVAVAVALFLGLLLVMRRKPVQLLASMQLFIGAGTFASGRWADQISLAFARMVAPLHDELWKHVDAVLGMMFLTSALLILPAALGMGAMFPLTMRVWTSGGSRIGKDVGLVYTGNTVGSIFGAWLPGFLLMPMLGMQVTLHVGVATNLLLGLLVLVVAEAVQRRRVGTAPLVSRAWAYGAAACVPIFLLALHLGLREKDGAWRWDMGRMTLGVFRMSLAPEVLDREAWAEPDLVYYRDGLSTTVTVERWGRHYALKNNGKVEASNGHDMPTQIMVSALPLVMHPQGPEDRDVAIIGFGSGVTVGAALQFPVASVKAVELERAVVEASRYFRDVNHLRYGYDEFPYVDTPRLRVINDDGRNYLASSPQKYDVIISEPSNPWITGVSDLFTADHFRVTKQKLQPGGIYCQWVQLYELSPLNVKSIYRTFASQFEHVVAFSAERGSSDTILLGSDAPLPLDVSRVEKAFSDARARRELQRAGVRSPHDVFARLLFASREEILRYARIEERRKNGRWVAEADSVNDGPCEAPACRRVPAPLNTDDNARIEFSAPKNLIGFERYRGYVGTFYEPEWPYGRVPDRLAGVGEEEQAATHYAEQAMAMMGHGRMVEAGTLIERSVAAANVPATRRATDLLALLMTKDEDAPLPDPPDDGRSVVGLEQPAAALLLEALRASRARVEAGKMDEAWLELQRVPEPLRLQAGPELALWEAVLGYHAGQLDDAIDSLESLLRVDPGFAVAHPVLHYYLAKAYGAQGEARHALDNMRRYVELRDATLPEGAGGS